MHSRDRVGSEAKGGKQVNSEQQPRAFTAKVKVANRGEISDYTPVTFVPDYEGGRNAEWAAATPSLSLTMSVKQEIAEFLTPGAAWMLRFEPEDTTMITE